MASHDPSLEGHLDATGDREVVFCHACAHEWYRDEHGLICPECEGEIIEIVDPENDPRSTGNDGYSSASTPSDFRSRGFRRGLGDDSDPDEADIEEHLGSQPGSAFNHGMRPGPGNGPGEPNVDPVIHRFIDMVNGFGSAQGLGGRPGYHAHSHTHDDENAGEDGGRGTHHDDEMPPHAPGFPPAADPQRHQYPPPPSVPRIHRATFRTGPFGGTASVTIFSGPFGNHGDMPQTEGGADPFQEIFSNVLRDMGQADGEPEHPGLGGGRPQGFIRSLQDLLGLLNPANAVVGDAVYSQEALDRIISSLMEANPQSNAAPPASEDAIRNLERKPVDKEMLANESKTECSICIDEIKMGDMALFLPCKHWFHEDCVVLWLKEHNTCPICRAPIEKNDREGASGMRAGAPNSAAGGPPLSIPRGFPNPPSADPQGSSQPGPSRWFGGGTVRPSDVLNDDSGPGSRPPQSARPSSQRHSRLNEALRSVSSMQERQREREREQATSSGVSYDTSRLQRRNSMSPTSPRVPVPGDQGSRMRQRSPSQSSGRWAESDREAEASSQRTTQRQTGPFSWLRGRLSGGSNNGQPPQGGRQP